MRKKSLFMRIIDFIENSFLKNHSCICCFREIPDNTKYMMCEECFNEIEFLDDKLCLKCGDKLNKAGNCINDCKKYNYPFFKNISLCYYTESAAKLIKNLKYGHKKYLAPYIAEILMKISYKIQDIDLIVYVPSSKKRLRERGFNQAEVLAKLLGEKLNKEVCDLLIKTKDTIHQAGGSQKERMKNLKGSFDVREEFSNKVEGKTVLIFDDVFTTGSTLSECARMVKSLRPKKIVTLTFAKTKFNITAET